MLKPALRHLSCLLLLFLPLAPTYCVYLLLPSSSTCLDAALDFGESLLQGMPKCLGSKAIDK